MDIIGIICEYNSLHNGHIYHIEKIKEMYPNSLIIAVISTNFCERGDISILTKWDKTKICLNHGIDLIVELPFVYATEAADIFAHASISILNYLKVNKIIFGSELDNIETLKLIANTIVNNNRFNQLIEESIKLGMSYATSFNAAIKSITNININTPNDILAISYITEIIKNNYNIEPISIKRTNDYHNSKLTSNIISASTIRELLGKNKSIKKYVPHDTLDSIINIDYNKYFTLLKYEIITHIDELDKFQTVDEGIENRIKTYIYNSNSLKELINNIKTRRYTYNRLTRMLIHILCNYTKEISKNNKEIKYIRILGFNTNGQKYLNKIKKEIDIPIITKYKDIKNEVLDLELKVSIIYGLISNISNINNIELSIFPIKKDS